MHNNKRISLRSDLKYLGHALCISLLLPITSVLADATVECNLNGSNLNTLECGVNSNATAAGATAIGDFTTASGFNSVAVGAVATASGGTSVAVGPFAWARSDGSVSVGDQAGTNSFTPVTDSNDAIAIGHYATIGAGSPFSIAIGGDANNDSVGTTASADGAIVIGSDATNSGLNAIGIGQDSKNTGDFSSNVGAFSEAHSEFSISMGFGAGSNDVPVTDSASSIAIGNFAKIGVASPGAIAIGGDLNSSLKGAEASAPGAIALGANVVNDVADSMLINVPFRIETDAAPGISPVFIVESTKDSVGVRNVIQLKNNGGVGFELRDTNLDNAWDFRTAGNGGFLVSNIGVPGSKLQINQNGTVFLNGGGFFLNGDTNNVTVGGTHTAIQHIASSSRAVKKDFTKINAKDVMSKIKNLEVTEWRYKDKAAQGRHIGPMAEDFYKLFKLGADDKHVSATDMASIAIIAAKELQTENTLLKKQGQQLSAKNDELEERLASLEKLVTNLASSGNTLPENGAKVVLIK